MVEGTACDCADERDTGATGETEGKGEDQGEEEDRCRKAAMEATRVYCFIEDMELVISDA